jgi:hypothetical protein
MEFVFLLGILLLVIGFGFYAWTMIRSVQTRLRNIEEFIREGGMAATQQPSALMEHMRNTHNQQAQAQEEEDDDAEDINEPEDGIWSGRDGESGIPHEYEFEAPVSGNVPSTSLDLAQMTTQNIGEEESPDAEGQHTQEDLEKMKVPEIKQLLQDMNVAFPSGSRKGDLINLVLSNQVIQEVPADEETEKGTGDAQEGNDDDIMDIEEFNQLGGNRDVVEKDTEAN